MGVKDRLSPYLVSVTRLSCNANLQVLFQGGAHSTTRAFPMHWCHYHYYCSCPYYFLLFFDPLHKSGKFTLPKAVHCARISIFSLLKCRFLLKYFAYAALGK